MWQLITTSQLGVRSATANVTQSCISSQRTTSPWLALGAEYLALDLRMIFSWIWDHSLSLLHLPTEGQLCDSQGSQTHVPTCDTKFKGTLQCHFPKEINVYFTELDKAHFLLRHTEYSHLGKKIEKLK